MGVFEMVVAVVLISTTGSVVRAWMKRSAKERGVVDERVHALEAELRSTEARLSQTEARLVELDEKLTFVEGLLAPPERTSRLPPSR